MPGATPDFALPGATPDFMPGAMPDLAQSTMPGSNQPAQPSSNQPAYPSFNQEVESDLYQGLAHSFTTAGSSFASLSGREARHSAPASQSYDQHRAALPPAHHHGDNSDFTNSEHSDLALPHPNFTSAESKVKVLPNSKSKVKVLPNSESKCKVLPHLSEAALTGNGFTGSSTNGANFGPTRPQDLTVPSAYNAQDLTKLSAAQVVATHAANEHAVAASTADTQNVMGLASDKDELAHQEGFAQREQASSNTIVTVLAAVNNAADINRAALVNSAANRQASGLNLSTLDPSLDQGKNLGSTTVAPPAPAVTAPAHTAPINNAAPHSTTVSTTAAPANISRDVPTYQPLFNQKQELVVPTVAHGVVPNTLTTTPSPQAASLAAPQVSPVTSPGATPAMTAAAETTKVAGTAGAQVAPPIAVPAYQQNLYSVTIPTAPTTAATSAPEATAVTPSIAEAAAIAETAAIAATAVAPGTSAGLGVQPSASAALSNSAERNEASPDDLHYLEEVALLFGTPPLPSHDSPLASRFSPYELMREDEINLDSSLNLAPNLGVKTIPTIGSTQPPVGLAVKQSTVPSPVPAPEAAPHSKEQLPPATQPESHQSMRQERMSHKSMPPEGIGQ